MVLKRTTVVFLLLIVSTAAGQEPGDSAPPPTWSENAADLPRRLPPVNPNDGLVAQWEPCPSEVQERLSPVILEDGSTPPPTDKGKDNSMPLGMFGQRSSPLSYRTAWFPAVPVSGQNTNFAMLDQNLSVMAPLWMMPSQEGSPLSRPAGGWMLSTGVRNRSIETDAVMPDSGRAYPNELWNVSMGLMYFRKLDNDWLWGGGVNLGSASDRPFASINEMFVGMNAFLRIPSGEHNAWMFSIMYAPMGELRFPIPGVAYSYAPSDDFHMNIGLPFSVMYRPIDRLTLEASYMLIYTIHAKAKYKISDWISAFAAYDWANDSYTLADRVDVNQRFYMYDQRLAAGLESKIGEYGFIEFAGGLTFDRYSFEGKQWDTTQFDRVSFGNGPFITLQAGLKFY